MMNSYIESPSHVQTQTMALSLRAQTALGLLICLGGLLVLLSRL